MLLFSVTRHLFCIHHNISMICLHPTNEAIMNTYKNGLLIIYQPSVSRENLLKEVKLKAQPLNKISLVVLFNANYFLFLICFFASFQDHEWYLNTLARQAQLFLLIFSIFPLFCFFKCLRMTNRPTILQKFSVTRRQKLYQVDLCSPFIYMRSTLKSADFSKIRNIRKQDY